MIWATREKTTDTGKKTQLIKPSNGKIHVLPGTEVEITAKTNFATTGANLVFNGKDNFLMNIKSEHDLKGNLLIKENGFYQFSVRDQKGNKNLLSKKYPVTLAKDRSPSIILFLANSNLSQNSPFRFIAVISILNSYFVSF